ncbi:MICOS complex subunit MIC60 [Mycoplasmopsis columbinasalis]|uniref:Uncharacterized protein n=1 Tax=Mycoplasmopsis columbinasalis TaxID=114880 RepID=A0A449BAX3_9BACT|nr:hypothetical protein [Mycoplasmopsis columbinasalis]VEU78358.1 Uncharacterised protein [Mycoplasmopsis columbinasalis]
MKKRSLLTLLGLGASVPVASVGTVLATHQEAKQAARDTSLYQNFSDFKSWFAANAALLDLSSTHIQGLQSQEQAIIDTWTQREYSDAPGVLQLDPLAFLAKVNAYEDELWTHVKTYFLGVESLDAHTAAILQEFLYLQMARLREDNVRAAMMNETAVAPALFDDAAHWTNQKFIQQFITLFDVILKDKLRQQQLILDKYLQTNAALNINYDFNTYKNLALTLPTQAMRKLVGDSVIAVQNYALSYSFTEENLAAAAKTLAQQALTYQGNDANSLVALQTKVSAIRQLFEQLNNLSDLSASDRNAVAQFVNQMQLALDQALLDEQLTLVQTQTQTYLDAWTATAQPQDIPTQKTALAKLLATIKANLKFLNPDYPDALFERYSLKPAYNPGNAESPEAIAKFSTLARELTSDLSELGAVDKLFAQLRVELEAGLQKNLLTKELYDYYDAEVKALARKYKLSPHAMGVEIQAIADVLKDDLVVQAQLADIRTKIQQLNTTNQAQLMSSGIKNTLGDLLAQANQMHQVSDKKLTSFVDKNKQRVSDLQALAQQLNNTLMDTTLGYLRTLNAALTNIKNVLTMEVAAANVSLPNPLSNPDLLVKIYNHPNFETNKNNWIHILEQLLTQNKPFTTTTTVTTNFTDEYAQVKASDQMLINFSNRTLQTERHYRALIAQDLINHKFLSNLVNADSTQGHLQISESGQTSNYYYLLKPKAVTNPSELSKHELLTALTQQFNDHIQDFYLTASRDFGDYITQQNNYIDDPAFLTDLTLKLDNTRTKITDYLTRLSNATELISLAKTVENYYNNIDPANFDPHYDASYSVFSTKVWAVINNLPTAPLGETYSNLKVEANKLIREYISSATNDMASLTNLVELAKEAITNVFGALTEFQTTSEGVTTWSTDAAKQAGVNLWKLWEQIKAKQAEVASDNAKIGLLKEYLIYIVQHVSDIKSYQTLRTETATQLANDKKVQPNISVLVLNTDYQKYGLKDKLDNLEDWDFAHLSTNFASNFAAGITPDDQASGYANFAQLHDFINKYNNLKAQNQLKSEFKRYLLRFDSLVKYFVDTVDAQQIRQNNFDNSAFKDFLHNWVRENQYLKTDWESVFLDNKQSALYSYVAEQNLSQLDERSETILASTYETAIGTYNQEVPTAANAQFSFWQTYKKLQAQLQTQLQLLSNATAMVSPEQSSTISQLIQEISTNQKVVTYNQGFVANLEQGRILRAQIKDQLGKAASENWANDSRLVNLPNTIGFYYWQTWRLINKLFIKYIWNYTLINDVNALNATGETLSLNQLLAKANFQYGNLSKNATAFAKFHIHVLEDFYGEAGHQNLELLKYNKPDDLLPTNGERRIFNNSTDIDRFLDTNPDPKVIALNETMKQLVTQVFGEAMGVNTLSKLAEYYATTNSDLYVPYEKLVKEPFLAFKRDRLAEYNRELNNFSNNPDSEFAPWINELNNSLVGFVEALPKKDNTKFTSALDYFKSTKGIFVDLSKMSETAISSVYTNNPEIGFKTVLSDGTPTEEWANSQEWLIFWPDPDNFRLILRDFLSWFKHGDELYDSYLNHSFLESENGKLLKNWFLKIVLFKYFSLLQIGNVAYNTDKPDPLLITSDSPTENLLSLYYTNHLQVPHTDASVPNVTNLLNRDYWFQTPPTNGQTPLETLKHQLYLWLAKFETAYKKEATSSFDDLAIFVDKQLFRKTGKPASELQFMTRNVVDLNTDVRAEYLREIVKVPLSNQELTDYITYLSNIARYSLMRQQLFIRAAELLTSGLRNNGLENGTFATQFHQIQDIFTVLEQTKFTTADTDQLNSSDMVAKLKGFLATLEVAKGTYIDYLLLGRDTSTQNTNEVVNAKQTTLSLLTAYKTYFDLAIKQATSQVTNAAYTTGETVTTTVDKGIVRLSDGTWNAASSPWNEERFQAFFATMQTSINSYHTLIARLEALVNETTTEAKNLVVFQNVQRALNQLYGPLNLNVASNLTPQLLSNANKVNNAAATTDPNFSDAAYLKLYQNIFYGLNSTNNFDLNANQNYSPSFKYVFNLAQAAYDLAEFDRASNSSAANSSRLLSAFRGATGAARALVANQVPFDRDLEALVSALSGSDQQANTYITNRLDEFRALNENLQSAMAPLFGDQSSTLKLTIKADNYHLANTHKIHPDAIFAQDFKPYEVLGDTQALNLIAMDRAVNQWFNIGPILQANQAAMLADAVSLVDKQAWLSASDLTRLQNFATQMLDFWYKGLATLANDKLAQATNDPTATKAEISDFIVNLYRFLTLIRTGFMAVTESVFGLAYNPTTNTYEYTKVNENPRLTSASWYWYLLDYFDLPAGNDILVRENTFATVTVPDFHLSNFADTITFIKKFYFGLFDNLEAEFGVATNNWSAFQTALNNLNTNFRLLKAPAFNDGLLASNLNNTVTNVSGPSFESTTGEIIRTLFVRIQSFVEVDKLAQIYLNTDVNGLPLFAFGTSGLPARWYNREVIARIAANLDQRVVVLLKNYIQQAITQFKANFDLNNIFIGDVTPANVKTDATRFENLMQEHFVRSAMVKYPIATGQPLDMLPDTFYRNKATGYGFSSLNQTYQQQDYFAYKKISAFLRLIETFWFVNNGQELTQLGNTFLTSFISNVPDNTPVIVNKFDPSADVPTEVNLVLPADKNKFNITNPANTFAFDINNYKVTPDQTILKTNLAGLIDQTKAYYHKYLANLDASILVAKANLPTTLTTLTDEHLVSLKDEVAALYRDFEQQVEEFYVNIERLFTSSNSPERMPDDAERLVGVYHERFAFFLQNFQVWRTIYFWKDLINNRSTLCLRRKIKFYSTKFMILWLRLEDYTL